MYKYIGKGHILSSIKTSMRLMVDEAKARMLAWETQILVRIQCPENPRVLPQDSSMEGELGIKQWFRGY